MLFWVGRCAAELFRCSKWRPFAVLDLYISAIFVKNSNLRLFLRRLAKFGEDRTMRGRVIAYFYFKNGGRRPSWIFIFSQFLWKISNLRPLSSSSCKIWWRPDYPRPSYCLFSIFKMAAVPTLDFHIFAVFVKNSNLRIFVVMQNLVKIITDSAAELLRVFDFQNGGRPPSWIWYDVIADHLRLVFDSPNILLKCTLIVFILRDIAIFIFGPFRLKVESTYSRPFMGSLGGIWRGSLWNWYRHQGSKI